MAEFKNMTVQALRDLARKALGRGYSRLKTKAELIQALQAAERKVATAAEKAAGTMKGAGEAAARASGRIVEAVRGKASAEPGSEKRSKGAREPARERGAEKARGRAAPPPPSPATGSERAESRGAARPRSKAGQVARETAQAVREVAAAAKAGARRVREAARGEPEPDPEGYMVARVAGEDAVRGAPHPMTESAMEGRRAASPSPRQPQLEPNAYDEQLGELPWGYADDVLVALPRDPRTLFLYWDHAHETLRRAWQDMDGGRAQLWVFVREAGDRWAHLRAIDFALESRSYYVHDLEPGRVYRAEIHVVDRAGKDRLLGRPSNEMVLPPVGPSPIIDDRFMRILWGEPLQRLLREPHPGAPFPDDVRAQLARLSDWSRFGGGSAGGMRGRPSSPTSPSSPWGGLDGGKH